MSWPKLKSQFFKDHPPTAEFFQPLAHQFAWNDTIIPVYQWQELIFVATSEPQAHVGLTDWPTDWVLVEAPHSELKKIWQTWDQPKLVTHLHMKTSEPEVELPPVPRVAPALSAKKAPAAFVVTPPPPPPQSRPEPSITSLRKSSAPAAVTSDFSPDQFLSEIAGALTVEQLPQEEGLEESVEEQEQQIEIQAPEDIELPEGFLNSNTDLLSINSLRANTVTSLRKDEVTATQSQAFEPAKALSKPAPANIATPAPPPKRAPPPITPESAKTTPALAKSQPAVVTPSVPASPASKPAAATIPASAKMPTSAPGPQGPKTGVFNSSQPPRSVSPEFANLAGELSAVPSLYYAAFLATKAGNSLRLSYWAPELGLSPGEYDFSLGTPSPFRISLRTEKPYHGYVIETSFLNQFFKHWNRGAIPETMTVVPIIKDLNVVGFIICLGKTEAADREALLAVEQIAAKLAPQWPRASDAKAS